MLNILTIKRRILLTFALLSSLAIYYFSDWVSDSSRRHYLEAAEEVLVDELIFLKSIVNKNTPESAKAPDFLKIKEYWEARDEANPAAKIYEVEKSSSDQHVYVTDSLGFVTYSSKNSSIEGQDFSKWRNVLLALKGKYGARSTRDNEDDPTSSVMHVTHPVEKNGQIIGTVTLVKPVKRISMYLDISRRKVARIAVITLLLFLILGFLLVWRIVNPIEELTAYTEKISKGERPSLPKLPKGELTLLGKTIAEMRRNLDGKAYIESYIRGLTHELKSPIAAIKGASELIDKSQLSDEDKRLVSNINRESDRMSEMVQKLLLLSRLENRDTSMLNERVNVDELIQEVISEVEERSIGRKVIYEAASCELKGDRMLLKTAVSNLINNALEFSENDVEVTLTHESGKVSIIVKDCGCGIPDYALDKVMEKFYSLPRPDSGAKSSGLGLSIVQEIVQLHGGALSVLNRSDVKSGVEARIEL